MDSAIVAARPPTAWRSVSENGCSGARPGKHIATGFIRKADVHVQAAARCLRKRFRHEARAQAVPSRDSLDRPLQEYGVVARTLCVGHVTQIYLELARREFLQRGARGDVLCFADRVQLGQERIDILDVLHAAVLWPILRPTRPRYVANLRGGAIAVRDRIR